MFLKILGVTLVALFLLGTAQAEVEEVIAWGVEPWFLGDHIDDLPKGAKLYDEDVQIWIAAFGQTVSCQVDRVYLDQLVYFDLKSSSYPTTARIAFLNDEVVFIQLIFQNNMPEDFILVQNYLEETAGQLEDGKVVFSGEETVADGTLQYSWRFHHPDQRQSVSVTYLIPPSEQPMLVVELTGGVFTRLFYEALNPVSAEQS